MLPKDIPLKFRPQWYLGDGIHGNLMVPMPPTPKEIGPYKGIINHHHQLINLIRPSSGLISGADWQFGECHLQFHDVVILGELT